MGIGFQGFLKKFANGNPLIYGDKNFLVQLGGGYPRATIRGPSATPQGAIGGGEGLPAGKGAIGGGEGLPAGKGAMGRRGGDYPRGLSGGHQGAIGGP